MSLENLPPVWEYWEPEDLEHLTGDELERLQLMLRSKMDVVTDSYERRLFWKDRERFIQLKTLAYRERPKRDFPF
jgi:hypothetical protein